MINLCAYCYCFYSSGGGGGGGGTAPLRKWLWCSGPVNNTVFTGDKQELLSGVHLITNLVKKAVDTAYDATLVA